MTEHAIVPPPIVDPSEYRGPATCWYAPPVCPNPARWMPVAVFVADGFPENARTRIPASLLHLGTCDACKAAAERSLIESVVPHMERELLAPLLRAARLASAHFVRIEWVQIAKEA